MIRHDEVSLPLALLTRLAIARVIEESMCELTVWFASVF